VRRYGQLHERVVRALYGELVRCGDEGRPVSFGDLGGRRLGKTGAELIPFPPLCRQRQTVHSLKRGLDPLEVIRQHSRIAGPFLAQCGAGWRPACGCGDLDDVLPRLGLRIDGIVQRFTAGIGVASR